MPYLTRDEIAVLAALRDADRKPLRDELRQLVPVAAFPAVLQHLLRARFVSHTATTGAPPRYFITPLGLSALAQAQERQESARRRQAQRDADKEERRADILRSWLQFVLGYAIGFVSGIVIAWVSSHW